MIERYWHRTSSIELPATLSVRPNHPMQSLAMLTWKVIQNAEISMGYCLDPSGIGDNDQAIDE